ncbi:LacI family DNA-binding transcriptional regulator [Demequina lignilytica]|uniref:LacI family DNA-binding transcriptional regulator n=1 Tax=Demequina lignilytica TaxID=3051663 RepID=A0AB35MEU1_9MICO|nr:LacI family DNA-binding transcriptional regulator [Demequina sp. SYSU T0a273]MDN4482267.1 LacI family DNA-binding transcriptional regulator [Demequina sp. SYSU T0a273]
MATLRDVAQAAGVSPATASRALSAPDSVSSERRFKVLEAAQRLGYQPNRSAQALASGRNRHLGLVLPDLANPYFATIAKGVQLEARESANAVLVADTDEDPRREHDVVRELQTRVDGVVLCSPRMPEEQILECAARGPLVLVNREIEGIPSVTFDVASGMRQTLLHLRALDHRTIAYVGGPETSWSDRHRRRGLDSVAGITVIDLGPHRPVHAGGFAAADLALETGATAVVCFNDLVALGVVSRLQSRGVAIPSGMNVVGFDNIPGSTYVTPALTTVAVPLQRAGREAAMLLDPSLSPADTAPAQLRLDVELIIRESTAPLTPAP